MLPRFHVPAGLYRFLQGEGFVEDGLDLSGFDEIPDGHQGFLLLTPVHLISYIGSSYFP